MDVLEQLQATGAVRRPENRDLGVIAVEADGGVGPLSTDRVTAEDAQPEVGEEGDRLFEVADSDADVLERDGHAWSAPAVRAVRGVGLCRSGDDTVRPSTAPLLLLEGGGAWAPRSGPVRYTSKRPRTLALARNRSVTADNASSSSAPAAN